MGRLVSDSVYGGCQAKHKTKLEHSEETSAEMLRLNVNAWRPPDVRRINYAKGEMKET